VKTSDIVPFNCQNQPPQQPISVTPITMKVTKIITQLHFKQRHEEKIPQREDKAQLLWAVFD
jgi:hypothetical protein